MKLKLVLIGFGLLAAAQFAWGGLAASQSKIPPVEPNVMRTESNAPVVKNVKMETQFVVAGGGRARVFAFDAL